MKIMKKITFLFVLGVLVTLSGFSQRFMTKNGTVRFYSIASLEKIEAVNQQVNAALDASSGDFVFKILIKSFQFKNTLMQEHFNENYLESDKIPNATFVGKITNIKDINLTKEGNCPVNVDGKLTIHGVTRDVHETGKIQVTGNMIMAKAIFDVTLADYNITIPKTVINNIAKNVEISVDVSLEKAKN